MRNNSLQKLLFSLVTLLACGTHSTMAQTKPAPKVDFALQVLPLLKANCFSCHAGQNVQGGLKLDSREAMLKGGVSGKTLLIGKGSQSLLLTRLMGQGGKPQMPIGFKPFSTEQVALVRQWVDEGAIWKSGNTRHWSYARPVRPALPRLKDVTWARNPIDAFVLERLEKEGLTPSSEASREALLRRASLDLIGLPPTLEEIDAFVKDKRPNAYEKAVDHLLASPHYGERWARAWLDLARYADTDGYEKDLRRSIWAYRDWVINAFNKDMPFDQFTLEQIAGDLLPNATLEQRIATGFHRNTMTNTEGGVDQQEARWLTNVDRVGTTAGVFLGTTLACSQCHNHKYDPFTMKDYYRVLAFWEPSAEPSLAVLTPELEGKRKPLQDQIDALNAQIKQNPTDKKQTEQIQKQIAEKQKQLDAIPVPTTLVFAEPANSVPKTFARVKGNYLSKAEEVTAGTPEHLNPFPKNAPLNRLGLAQWLTAPENPLMARVAVNRLWEHLFGVGIVETSEDFGTQGQRPTHPKLLDWLATEMVRQKWSLKTLCRLIVTSATYRQSSRVSPRIREKDPFNRLLARGPRFRLEAEMVRDVALASSGLLSHKIGGPSVYPVQPDGIWDIPYNGEQWANSTGEDRYRRGIYTFWRRTSPYPAFMNFDATSRESCTIRRIRTNTPLQALNTLNDLALIEAARALGERMRNEGGKTLEAQLTYGFRRVLTRYPSAQETNRLIRLYQLQKDRYQKEPERAVKLTLASLNDPALADKAAWTLVANVLLNLDEALTNE